MYRALRLQGACRTGIRIVCRRSASVRVLSSGATHLPVLSSYGKMQRSLVMVGNAGGGHLLFPCRKYSDLPIHKVVTLPALSPTMETGTIASWEMEEGAEVSEGDVLAQVETDKATMDMETPREGYLAKILVPAGTKDIPLGTPVCILVEDEGDMAAFKDYQPPALETPAAPASKPVADTPPPPAAAPPPPTPPVEAAARPPPPPTPVAAAPPTTGAAGRVFASPYAKTVAASQGVDLSNVQGTGMDGRVVSRDVLASTGPAVAAPGPAAMTGAYTDLDLSNMRKTIAKRLQEAKQSIPHYYLTVDVNMTKTLALRQTINSSQQGHFKLSPNDFVIKAAALALRQVPEVNSSWMETFIRQHHSVDISVAVSTEGGLITPIVFGADGKGLRAINQDVVSLAEKARNGKLKPEEYLGGTFTISNLGMYGVKQFSAIINPPQSCVLAVGSVEKRIVPSKEAESEAPSVADMMTVTMSCDHRVVDGAVGAQWLVHFKGFLEEPSTMLL